MKKLGIMVSLLLSAGIVVACSLQKTRTDDILQTDAATLWTYITQTMPYTEWDRFKGTGELIDAAPPHGPKAKVYANELAKRSQYTANDGSIIVMEDYEENGTTLRAVTLMQKRTGYNPEAGDWFWAKFSPDGTVIEEGKIQKCIECHVSMAFDDYTFIRQW